MKSVLILLQAIVFISCNSAQKEKPTTIDKVSSLENKTKLVATPPISKGKMVNPVFCLKDASQSYAAYLPSNYDSTKKFPLLIAFDAHAEGRIPIELYKGLSEKYGYMMVASNNSKNGLDATAIANISSTLLSDVTSRLSYDARRVYLSGFSGGARVAANLALQGGFAGLASCSAGFQPLESLPFNFIGFAGTEDFNSNELIELNKKLDATNAKHQLILFEGKHEWPPAEVFENAFLWFDFSAMKENSCEKNEKAIHAYELLQTSKIKALQAKGDLYAAFVESNNSIAFLKDLSNSLSFQELRTKLAATAVVKNRIAERELIVKEETELQQYYRNALQQKDVVWWNHEIDNLIDLSKSKRNSAEKILLYKRSLSFLSLLCYMASNSMLSQNQLESASMYLKLYEKVDPQNSEVYYLQALLAAKRNAFQDILPYLQKAMKNGFTDRSRIEAEQLFSSLKQNPEYAEFLKKIKGLQ